MDFFKHAIEKDMLERSIYSKSPANSMVYGFYWMQRNTQYNFPESRTAMTGSKTEEGYRKRPSVTEGTSFVIAGGDSFLVNHKYDCEDKLYSSHITKNLDMFATKMEII